AVFVLGSAVAAGADTILELIAGRVLQGAGAISSTLTALLADSTREHIRLRATAVLGISIGAGFLLALVGGPLLASIMSVRAMFVVSAGCGLLAIALTLWLPRSAGAPARRHAAEARTGPGVVAAGLLRLDAAVLLLHLTLTALFVLLPFVLRDTAGLAPARHWLFHAGAIVLSLAVTLPLLLRSERAAPGRLPAVAMLLCAAGCLLMAAAPGSLPLLFAGALTYFAGFNYLEAGLPAWVSLAAPAARRGAAMGVFASAQFLGAFLGGVLAGALLQTLGDPADGFVALALPGLLGCAALLRDPADRGGRSDANSR
ncbi:MAG: MFS transporter, partial [Pseudomonadota bacterium]